MKITVPSQLKVELLTPTFSAGQRVLHFLATPFQLRWRCDIASVGDAKVLFSTTCPSMLKARGQLARQLCSENTWRSAWVVTFWYLRTPGKGCHSFGLHDFD